MSNSPRILIERCSDGMMWYASSVGLSVPLLFQDEGEFVVRTPNGYTNIVLLKDGRVVFGGEDHV